jgi:hypothetical protein
MRLCVTGWSEPDTRESLSEEYHKSYLITGVKYKGRGKTEDSTKTKIKINKDNNKRKE